MTTESDRMIGPYRVLTRVGRGGMGVVYSAEDPGSGEKVALKTVRAMSHGHLARLRREIVALARIRHPGIVRIVAQGTDQGVPWYAMELVRGWSLKDYIWTERRGTATTYASSVSLDAATTRPSSEHVSLPSSAGSSGTGRSREFREPFARAADGRLAQALTVMERLCTPLAYLHGEGIVHRDLKPGNVLVREGGQPVLVDLGLMWRAGEGSREILHVEQELVGTVYYMSPEQVRGEMIDARADLYSLGCILYEVLVGLPPFVADRASEVMDMHETLNPEPPSAVVRGVPPLLDQLVLDLLEKNPRHRIGHAGVVANRLVTLGAEPDDRADLPTPRPYLYRPGFAGRRNSLKTLTRHLERLRRGHGGLVLISGESGVGKTRLAMELGFTRAGRDIRVLTGECPSPVGHSEAPAGRQPLQGLQKALVMVADRCRERGSDETERLVGHRGAVLALYQSAFADLPYLRPPRSPAELPLTLAVRRLFTYLADTFEALAAEAPLLLIVDDLHWADDLLVGFLRFLQQEDRFKEAPVLVVGTFRSDEPDTLIAPLTHHPRTEIVTVGRLGDESVAQIVEDMLAVSEPPAGLIGSIVAHSEGNPFFVAEYVRTAVDQEVLTRNAKGTWVVKPEAFEQGDSTVLAMPRSLRELVTRRLAGLGADARELLEIAAVVGGAMDDAVLTGLQEDLEQDKQLALGALREILVHQVLEETQPGRYRFAHDHIRQVAYQRISAEHRRSLHRRVATYLEREAPDHQADLGRHWENAGEPARAVTCYLAAATHAQRRYSNLEAEQLLRASRRLAVKPSAPRVEASMNLASLLFSVHGKAGEVLEAYWDALEDARALADPDLQGRCLEGLANVYWVTGRVDEAHAFNTKAIESYRQAGNAAGEANAIAQQAVIYHQQGQVAEARGMYLRAIEMARREGDVTMMAGRIGNLASLDRQEGHVERALDGYRRALAMHIEEGNRRGEGATLQNLGELCIEVGRLDDARGLAERALSLFREVGNRRAEAHSFHLVSAVERLAGRLDLAKSHAQRALQIGREVKDRHLEARAVRSLATVMRLQGDADPARDELRRALALHREIRDRGGEGSTLLQLAILMRQAYGDLESAARFLSLALQIAQDLRRRSEVALYRCEMGHLRLARGEGADAELTSARDLAREVPSESASELGQALKHLEATIAGPPPGQTWTRGEWPPLLPPPLRAMVEKPAQPSA